jgi:hypothetical protein
MGITSIDDFRCSSEVFAWAIMKRAGVKVEPQHRLMTHVFGAEHFGHCVVDPHGDLPEDCMSVPAEELRREVEELKRGMQDQKILIQSDRAEPLTAEQRRSLHPDVQRMSRTPSPPHPSLALPSPPPPPPPTVTVSQS